MGQIDPSNGAVPAFYQIGLFFTQLFWQWSGEISCSPDLTRGEPILRDGNDEPPICLSRHEQTSCEKNALGRHLEISGL